MMKPKSELDYAIKFFDAFPLKRKIRRKTHNTLSSYIQFPNGRIVRLKNKTEAQYLGQGTCGHVKASEALNPLELAPAESTCIKIQEISLVSDKEWILQESEINFDMGIAIGPMIEIKKTVTKAYQEMRLLGKSIEQILAENIHLNFQRKIEFSIEMILNVYEMHEGLLSRSGKKYIHRDIHTGNFLLDEMNNIHIIDFSFSHESSKNASENHDVKKDNKDLLKMIFYVNTTLEDFLWKDSLINQDEFNKLPLELQELFDLENPALSQNNYLKFLAAALILYKNKEDRVNEIRELKKDSLWQDKLIAEYYQHKKNTRCNKSTLDQETDSESSTQNQHSISFK